MCIFISIDIAYYKIVLILKCLPGNKNPVGVDEISQWMVVDQNVNVYRILYYCNPSFIRYFITSCLVGFIRYLICCL